MRQRADDRLDTTVGRQPLAELPNDLIAVGETAAREFTRGTKKLKEQIEPMAHGLAEAKRRYPANIAFGAWVDSSAYAEVSHQDRAALIKLGENWDDEIAARFAELDSYSPELIVRKLFYDNRKTEEEGDDEDDDSGSEFYGSERITRANEAWDTIDPRLVKSLIAAIPALTARMVWEPSAGCGLMLDQLKAAGVAVCAGTDIAPRREDIAQLDLLTATEMFPGTDAIITNPPWGRLAAAFVRKTLELAEQRKALVAMLLPLPWIAGRKIADMTGSPSFDVLIVPRYRARWMTPEEEAELAASMAADGKTWSPAPKMNHVWLVWDFARDPDLLPGIRFVDAPPEDAAIDDDEIEEAAE
ncbi:hypothetical protein KIP88_03115 [Bradyrhizobium sp. SRL28]|uniref:hypothetical protein n=1 Tax=Bradyrhizobium sp. SRL28 TaxID=2836178 RepID=UPI001BDF0FD0|nr:hypothetical protein [Bradyrhizobium sp. SRL28]MBT1509483.1 hypothetical protein [Bradyrhizobium sp. SRL28]